MNKTPEINPSRENPKIPENWKFPERGNPSLIVSQIDIDEKFLALSFPRKPSNYSDYFFDADGNLSAHRTHSEGETIVFLIVEGIGILYDISKFSPRDLSVDFLLSPPTEEDLMPASLGGFKYQNEHLDKVILGGTFTVTDQELIKSPYLYLDVKHKIWNFMPFIPMLEWPIEGEIEEGSNYNIKLGKFSIQQRKGRNETTVFDANKEEIFRIKYYEEENEVRQAGIKIPFLVVSQTYIPTKIEKILRAPLRVNRQEYTRAAYLKPPYSKQRLDSKDRLDIPWRNIGEIVGARLSYSYPPEKHKR